MRPNIPEKTRNHLEWFRILARLADHCRSPVAVEQALRLDFAESIEERTARIDRVTEARELLDAGRTPPVGSAPDVAQALKIAARGGLLEPEELKAIGYVIESAARCRIYFAGLPTANAEHPTPLAQIAESLASLPDLGRALLDSFDEHGTVTDSASGELGYLRTRVTGLHGQLKTRIDGLLGDTEYQDLLQDEYVTIRDDRYVLPIKSGHKRHVAGIVHGWSASGATVYIEPQVVVDANNKLMMAQAEVDREIRRILKQLSRQVGGVAKDIQRSQDALTVLDLAVAAAVLSKEFNATPPVFADQLSLIQARHPLLILQGIEVIPNTVALVENQRALVITGPNTGGKTVALKTTGLCALMALSGLHIPAALGSTLPAWSGVFTDMGDEQSLDENRSTFSGHIANLLEIFAALRPGGLVLLDELVVGTDPLQGAALAQALLEDLAGRDTMILVTTHYEALKALPFNDERFRNGAVGFDPERRAPTYHLTLDVPGASSALQTARRLGLDTAIVERAVELAGPKQRQLEVVIERLEAEATAVRKARKAVEAEQRTLEKSRRDAETIEARLRQRLKDGVARERSETLNAAKRLRDEITTLRKQLRRPDQRRDVAVLAAAQNRAKSVIDKVLTEQASVREAAAGPALDPKKLQLGQRVWVLSLENEAELSSLPDDRGRCRVQAGILSAQVEISDLRAVQGGGQKRRAWPGTKRKSTKRKPTPVESNPGWEEVEPQTPANTVDLRGRRVDEALDMVERFLDAQLERNAEVAFIIHGHGTGALKTQVRQWLRTCSYARDQRPGRRSEGGDGVTAVLLR